MKELTGSEKQITWAEKLRTKAINEIGFELENLNMKLVNAKYKESLSAIISKLEESLEEIKNKAEAKWWIDNQNIARHSIEKASHREL